MIHSARPGNIECTGLEYLVRAVQRRPDFERLMHRLAPHIAPRADSAFERATNGITGPSATPSQPPLLDYHMAEPLDVARGRTQDEDVF